MIGAVDLAVAVHAAPVHHERRGIVAGQTVLRVGNARVPALRMAGLAQQRRPPCEQSRLDRPVRLVAQQTVLADRGMLEEIGAAQLRMAAPAQFIDGVANKQAVSPGVMRIVTWWRMC